MITINGRRHYAAVMVQEALKHHANRLSERVAAMRDVLETVAGLGIRLGPTGQSERQNPGNLWISNIDKFADAAG